MPTELDSLSDLNSRLQKSGDKLSVIDFHATWCGPCHAIAPEYERLSKQYTNVNFFKVDVDKAQDIASQYRVSAMPTFIFLKGSTKVDQVRGANKAALEDAIKRHSGGSSGAFSGKGQTLGGGSAPTDIRREINSTLSGASGAFSGLDPQVKVLGLLLGAYLLLWWFSG